MRANTRSLLPILSAAAVAVVACSAIVDPNKISPTKTVAGLCDAVKTIIADRTAECLGVPLAWAQAQESGISCSAWTAAVAAGRLVYDSGQGNACLQDVQTIACAELFAGGGGPPGACAKALVGQVALNGTCGSSEECASGTYCSFTGCTGTCVAYAQQGQPCAGTQCASGLECLYSAASGTSTCQPPLAAGAACPSGGCATGLYCDATTVKCVAQATSGSCSQGDACLLPLYVCSGASPSAATPGQCQALAREGQACLHGYGDCAWGTYCNTGSATPALGTPGTCVIYPGPPAACGAYGAEAIACLGSYCSATATAGIGTCTGYIATGASCSSTGPSDQCGPGSSCPAGAASPVCTVTCP